MCVGQGATSVVTSLLPPCWSQGSNSGHDWWLASLSTETLGTHTSNKMESTEKSVGSFYPFNYFSYFQFAQILSFLVACITSPGLPLIPDLVICPLTDIINFSDKWD